MTELGSPLVGLLRIDLDFEFKVDFSALVSPIVSMIGLGVGFGFGLGSGRVTVRSSSFPLDLMLGDLMWVRVSKTVFPDCDSMR